MIRILVILFPLIIFSCSNKSHCKPSAIQKLSAFNWEENDYKTFAHFILIEDLSKNCDSITVMTAIKIYTETVGIEKPIGNVTVFNSNKHYEKGENPYADAVVEVLFDETPGIPIKFTFFDRNGNQEYEGVRWKP